MHLPRPITGEVNKIIKKVEQDRHISSHNIDKELNIDHKRVLNIWRRLDKKNSMFGGHMI